MKKRSTPKASRKRRRSTQPTFSQQSQWLGIGTLLVAVTCLLCPQPPVTDVTKEIALPLATQYVKGRYQPPPADSEKPLAGVRVLITGPTSGIGLGLSTVLSEIGAQVVGIGRSESKLQQLVDNQVLTGYHVADMADLESIADAANQVLGEYEKIDMIIANAGVHYHWTTFGSPATKQGLDLVFGVNYMSHFLLIEKLIPLLERSNYAKLLYVNSFFHYTVDGSALKTNNQRPPNWIYANFTCPHPFFRDQYVYGSSKFSMMLHAETIRARYSKLNVVSADPGWTATNINGGKGSIAHVPLQWIGFPVMGWGLASILNALFSLDDRRGGKKYWSNARNYFILPTVLNSHVWRERIPRWVKDDYLQLRDWIGVIQGFALGFLQRFHYHAAPMPPAIETTDRELQWNVHQWSKEVVAEWLE